MKRSVSLILLIVALTASSVRGFAPSSLGGVSGGSRPAARPFRTSLAMGGKSAKFGVFSPAVYAGKAVLGTDRLIKIRAKAIGLHSGKIKEFCAWSGATHMQVRLIKLAKENGDVLGFLV